MIQRSQSAGAQRKWYSLATLKLLAFVVFVAAIWPTSVLVMLPENWIAKRLEKRFPLASDRTVIERKIVESGFEVASSSVDRGFLWAGGRILGSSVTSLDLGHYRRLFTRDVLAVVVFDSDQRLESIRVWKEIDAP